MLILWDINHFNFLSSRRVVFCLFLWLVFEAHQIHLGFVGLRQIIFHVFCEAHESMVHHNIFLVNMVHR